MDAPLAKDVDLAGTELGLVGADGEKGLDGIVGETADLGVDAVAGLFVGHKVRGLDVGREVRLDARLLCADEGGHRGGCVRRD